MTKTTRRASPPMWRAAWCAAGLAGCGCEGRAFTLRRGDVTVAEGCAEVADTAAARSVGLIGREPLPAGRALWLAFPMETEACVVNGDVRFAIDVAWVGADGSVRDVARGVPAGDASPRCHEGVVGVLEWSSSWGVEARAGDVVRW